MAYVFNDIELEGNFTGARSYVRVATTASGTLATDFEAGDTVDGVVLAAGDRILIKNQVSATENGIYEVLATGTPSRADDMETGEGVSSAYTWVRQGTDNGNTAWICTNAPGSDVVGTDGLTFVQFDVVSTLAIARGGTNATSFNANGVAYYDSGSDSLLSTTSVANAVVVTDGSGVPATSTTIPVATQNNIVHGNLSGLAADDHLQYALLAGRGAGQTLIGGTGASNNLQLQSTSNATRGAVQILDDAEIEGDLDTIAANPLVIGGTNATQVDIATATTATRVLGDLNVEQAIDTIAGNSLTIGGTTATSVVLGGTASSSVDSVDLFRVTAGTGFGIDTIAAGTLIIGEATATKIEIADSGVTTDIEGLLQVQGVIDRISAGNLQLGGTNATNVEALDRLLVPTGSGGGIDATGAGVLVIGEANATSIEIADTGVTTEIQGPVEVEGSIDTITGTTLTVGSTNATKIEIGSSSVLTEIVGDLLVQGTTTSIGSEIVNVADNHLYLNSNYTTAAAETGGLVVNYLPIAGSAVAGVAFTANSVEVASAAGFAIGQFIQVSGANTEGNNGIFEIAGIAANVITIDTTPTEDFTQNSFTLDSTVAGTVTRVNLSVIRAGTDGVWETGIGSTVPLTFNDLATGGTARSFSILPIRARANNASYRTVGYFAWDDSLYGSASTRTCIIWAETSAGRGLDVEVFDGTTQLGTVSVPVSNTGIFTFTFTNPGTDARLEVRIRRTGVSGSNPSVYGIQFELTG